MKIHPLLFLFCIGLLLSMRPAAADTTHCTAITSLPNTISNPGVYCLTQDLVYGQNFGSAITIAADGVTLDLNGHAVRFEGTPNVADATLTGIYVGGHYYVSIIDGTVAGFLSGVTVNSSSSKRSRGGLVAQLRIQRSAQVGLYLDCDGCTVRDNMIVDTQIPSSWSPSSSQPYGLWAFGNGNLITGNRVYNTNPLTHTVAHAIEIDAQNSTVSNNYVDNDQMDTTSAIYGIRVSDGNNLVTGNQVQNMVFCFWFVGTSAKYRDNLTATCGEDFGGGTGGVFGADLGGNN